MFVIIKCTLQEDGSVKREEYGRIIFEDPDEAQDEVNLLHSSCNIEKTSFEVEEIDI